MKASVIFCASAAALLVASVLAFFSYQNRKDILRLEVEKAQSLEEAAAAQLKEAEANKSAEALKSRRLDAEIRRQEAELKSQEAAAKAADAEFAVTEAKRKLAEAEADIAERKAQETADARQDAEARLKAARYERESALAKQRTAEADAQRAADARAKAEAETVRMRHTLEQLEAERAECDRRLAELVQAERELEAAREALKPEKTIADLMGDDVTSRTNAPCAAVASDRTESWMTTGAERRLKEVERSRDEVLSARSATNRAETVAKLERLLEKAISEKREVDAQFYFKTVKSLYPDWTYKKTEDKK